ncbi:MAG TPA: 1-(5-phosphoribosyl)-5-[(5-phosphoribosylamino)methylideneamino] imidazole-4-carboxamide isomerase [Thermoanaerobaculaceae bacterium]|nr:1-(5-phosphoribosyl)-5-[(5-phosphoribosylamino)methylideneamino] imidazole-4-carboxamide isomerase [Thermoanaerobaculaceae bacterium]
MSFAIIPAIDLSGGRAVRLHQGRRDRMRVVAEDPLALARRFAAEGASLLHLVDLDAAFGDSGNGAAVEAIVADAGCPVEVGGGVRSAARFHRLRALGAARVVLGTAALRAPELLAELVAADRDAVVVAADARGDEVVVAGWTEAGGEDVATVAARMRGAGVRHLLVTAVERDGTGGGPDIALLERALGAFGPGVIASGGVGGVEHVRLLAPLAARGLAGVVVGSLLVDGRATLADLCAAAAVEPAP